MKNKNIAAFLAIVFGVIGFQKLYLGNKAEFLFCVFIAIISFGSVTLLFGIYDGLNLIQQNWNKFNRRYNRNNENIYKKI